ncbi:MAG: hypothetical protein ACKVT1_19125 [Dehalococcoidia bacterium]
MAVVKRAVSFPGELSMKLDELTRERGCSRSAIVSEAVQRYLEDMESAEFTRRLDAALALLTPEDIEEDLTYARAAMLSLSRIQDAEGDTWSTEE